MTTNLAQYKSDLEKLLKLGDTMRKDLMLRHLINEGTISSEQKVLARQLDGTFEASYQKWYTESAAVIRQLIPNRLAEFEQLYKSDGKRREVNAMTYCIQDWLN